MKLFIAISLVLLLISAKFTLAGSTIPLMKLQGAGAYLKGSPDADRCRSALLKDYTLPATNLIYAYTTRVGIGSPPTYYNLLVDVGSSNTLCGTGTSYVQTQTSIPTGEAVNITYGTAYFSGLEYLDQVTLSPDLVIVNQSISGALAYGNFPSGVDGIIGLGPVDVTQGTLSPDTNATIPTVMNNLVSQGLVKNQVLGVYFSPSTKNIDENGALTYGGIASNLHEGEITYVPVTETRPSSHFWGINVTSSTYGTKTIIPTSTAGIVDTGTTLVLLANDFFDAYLEAIPGATIDRSTDLIEIPVSSIASMQPLNFVIAGRVLSMDVAAQLIPPEQNLAWGGVAWKRYGVIINSGNHSGRGMDFILGQKFLERYYTVFDTDANRIGFARTKHTFTDYQG